MDLMIPLKNMGVDTNLLDALHDLLDFSDEQNQASHHAPSRQYVREAKAMSATPADVKETQNAYIFVIDVPGLKSDQIKVHLEDDNVLVVCGERKREKERDQGVRYLRMERRLGKYLKKFVLPENANVEKISAECQDGVLTIVVEKKPPPELKKPKIVQVRIGSSQEGKEGQGGQWGQEGQSGGQGDQWGQKGQEGQGGQWGQEGQSGGQGDQWGQKGQGGQEGQGGQGGGQEQQVRRGGQGGQGGQDGNSR